MSPDRPVPAAPTHAGGLVHRTRAGVREYLVVTSLRNAAHWVLPKGHVDPGETLEAAAVREVEEETGVVARPERELGETLLDLPHEHQRIRWYLMAAVGARPAEEERRVEWLRFRDALLQLSFEDTRALVRTAETWLTSGDPPRG